MPSTRVLAVVHWYLPHHGAGAEVMLHAMLRALADHGHTVDVLESSPPKNESYRHHGYDIDGIRVHPHSREDDLPSMLATHDVLVTHLANTQRSVRISRQMSKPCFVIHHDDLANWNGDPDIHHVYNSRWLRDRLQAAKPTPHHLVVRPPVRSAQYRTTPGSHVTLINLSRLKGVELFYELAHRMPAVRFLGVVGAYGEQIVKEAPNVEITEHVRPDSMRSVYAKTRVLLVPSHYETWGRSGVEAMSSGIPVIANPTLGLLESLGSAGVFVRHDSVDGWQAAVTNLMDATSWRQASRRALLRSAELDRVVEEDLARWCDAVENACR